MTTTDHSTAAGVFVVRDPDVCAALEQLLAPHRTSASPAPQSNDTALLARAQRHAVNLIAGPDDTPLVGETIEQVLDRVHGSAFTEGRAQATDEGREWSEAMDERVRRAESAVAHGERELDKTRGQLKDALAKIAELEARPGTRRPTVSALRLKDQAAFADLARRMEDNALTQPKPRAEVLRIAAKYLRDEIAAVYGGEKRAS